MLSSIGLPCSLMSGHTKSCQEPPGAVRMSTTPKTIIREYNRKIAFT